MEIQTIHRKIHEIRGQRIMLDFDLAELYEVETRILNQAVKRNIDIFPEDFMFQLTIEEWALNSSQNVMSSRKTFVIVCIQSPCYSLISRHSNHL